MWKQLVILAGSSGFSGAAAPSRTRVVIRPGLRDGRVQGPYEERPDLLAEGVPVEGPQTVIVLERILCGYFGSLVTLRF